MASGHARAVTDARYGEGFGKTVLKSEACRGILFPWLITKQSPGKLMAFPIVQPIASFRFACSSFSTPVIPIINRPYSTLILNLAT